MENIFFPYICVLCHDSSDTHKDLCSQCEEDLPKLTSACRQCANPLNFESLCTDLICGNCITNPPSFHRVVSIYSYANPIDHLILRLKFGKKLMYAKLLGELMAAALWDQYQTCRLPECIIPVPLHKDRLRERGFNQSLELARPIAKKLNIPLEMFLCKRSRDTKPQTTLPINQRKQNVKKAFSEIKAVSYRKVAIVDDVMTTGHTVEELSKVLRRAGVEEVIVWCCARAGNLDK